MSSITVKGEEPLLSKCTELHQRSQLQIIRHERRSLLNPNNGGRYLTMLFLSIHFTRWRVRCWIWENFCTDKEEFYMLFDVVGVTTAGSVGWTQKKWTDNVSLEINRVGHFAELLKLWSHCSRVTVWTPLILTGSQFWKSCLYTRRWNFKYPKIWIPMRTSGVELLRLREV